MKEIQLSKRGKYKGKYVALVDDEDYENINQYNWTAIEHRNTVYAVRTAIINGKPSGLQMHQMILSGKGIDHIDHNGLNNQKNNLRFCTNRENQMNRRKRKGCTSIYKGVSFHKHRHKWRVCVAGNYLGLFKNEADAAKAYNIKANELFGEFASLNIIL